MVEGGDDIREIIVDGEGVSFVVGAVRVSETRGTHGKATGVPGVGNFEGVGGEGSEDIGEGVGGDVFLDE